MKKTKKNNKKKQRKNKTNKCKNIGSTQFEINMIKKRIALVKFNNKNKFEK
jgi:hypothetical protein